MSANLKLLQADEALAKRWLRLGHIPIGVWRWLGGRASSSSDQPLTPQLAPSALTRALAEFAQPLTHNATAAQRQSLTHTLEQMAHLCAWSYAHVRSTATAASTERMLAAAVLPLYRGLAAGSTDEITGLMKQQLADALALTALECEFEEELQTLVAEGTARNQSPYEVVERILEIDLGKLAEALLIACQRNNNDPATSAQLNAPNNLKSAARPDWGQAHVLWRLAGELIADRAEFVVPRPWINVPVPWNEASEHWRAVADALRRVEPISSTNNSKTTSASTELNAPNQLNIQSAVADKSSPISASSDARNATQPTNGNDPAKAMSATQTTNGASQVTEPDEITRLKLEIEIADSVDALVQASRGATRMPASDRGVRTDGSSELAGSRARQPEFVVPKVIIAEVRSHNDPAFVSIVRRQIALCRSEERSLSLVAVCVEPDGDEDAMPTLESLGLACWQQKLVNWMADHPEIRDPYAFVSGEGELILCLMDVERNTTTGLLRQGLIEVLTGQSLGGDASSLSRVSAPARYYSGIGSLSSPTAGFEAEQLIEATYRCLSAAQRHGKASIKSIEVF